MLNLGAGEIAVILVVALLVLGPKRLPELARGIGKFMRDFRRQTDEVRTTLETEFYRMDQEILKEDVKLHAVPQEAQAQLPPISGPLDGGRRPADELGPAVAPPATDDESAHLAPHDEHGNPHPAAEAAQAAHAHPAAEDDAYDHPPNSGDDGDHVHETMPDPFGDSPEVVPVPDSSEPAHASGAPADPVPATPKAPAEEPGR